MHKKVWILHDETQTFEKGKIDLVNLGNIVIGRGILEPGWSWEKCLKPKSKLVKGQGFSEHIL
jgi:hypothetical protein